MASTSSGNALPSSPSGSYSKGGNNKKSNSNSTSSSNATNESCGLKPTRRFIVLLTACIFTLAIIVALSLTTYALERSAHLKAENNLHSMEQKFVNSLTESIASSIDKADFAVSNLHGLVLGSIGDLGSATVSPGIRNFDFLAQKMFNRFYDEGTLYLAKDGVISQIMPQTSSFGGWDLLSDEIFGPDMFPATYCPDVKQRVARFTMLPSIDKFWHLIRASAVYDGVEAGVSPFWGFTGAILDLHGLSTFDSVAEQSKEREMDYAVLIVDEQDTLYVVNSSTLDENSTQKELRQFLEKGRFSVIESQQRSLILVLTSQTWSLVNEKKLALSVSIEVLIPLLFLICFIFWYLRRSKAYNGFTHAPKEPPFAILKIGPRHAEEQWSLAPEQMSEASEKLTQMLDHAMANHKAYAVPQLHPYTSTYILSSVEAAVQFAVQVMKAAHEHTIDESLVSLLGEEGRLILSCSIHWCTEAEVTVHQERETVQYRGVDVIYGTKLWIFCPSNRILLSKAAKDAFVASAVKGVQVQYHDSIFIKGYADTHDVFTVFYSGKHLKRDRGSSDLTGFPDDSHSLEEEHKLGDPLTSSFASSDFPTQSFGEGRNSLQDFAESSTSSAITALSTGGGTASAFPHSHAVLRSTLHHLPSKPRAAGSTDGGCPVIPVASKGFHPRRASDRSRVSTPMPPPCMPKGPSPYTVPPDGSAGVNAVLAEQGLSDAFHVSGISFLESVEEDPPELMVTRSGPGFVSFAHTAQKENRGSILVMSSPNTNTLARTSTPAILQSPVGVTPAVGLTLDGSDERPSGSPIRPVELLEKAARQSLPHTAAFGAPLSATTTTTSAEATAQGSRAIGTDHTTKGVILPMPIVSEEHGSTRDSHSSSTLTVPGREEASSSLLDQLGGPQTRNSFSSGSPFGPASLRSNGYEAVLLATGNNSTTTLESALRSVTRKTGVFMEGNISKASLTGYVVNGRPKMSTQPHHWGASHSGSGLVANGSPEAYSITAAISGHQRGVQDAMVPNSLVGVEPTGSARSLNHASGPSSPQGLNSNEKLHRDRWDSERSRTPITTTTTSPNAGADSDHSLRCPATMVLSASTEEQKQRGDDVPTSSNISLDFPQATPLGRKGTRPAAEIMKDLPHLVPDGDRRVLPQPQLPDPPAATNREAGKEDESDDAPPAVATGSSVRCPGSRGTGAVVSGVRLGGFGGMASYGGGASPSSAADSASLSEPQRELCCSRKGVVGRLGGADQEKRPPSSDLVSAPPPLPPSSSALPVHPNEWHGLRPEPTSRLLVSSVSSIFLYPPPQISSGLMVISTNTNATTSTSTGVLPLQTSPNARSTSNLFSVSQEIHPHPEESGLSTGECPSSATPHSPHPTSAQNHLNQSRPPPLHDVPRLAPRPLRPSGPTHPALQAMASSDRAQHHSMYSSTDIPSFSGSALPTPSPFLNASGHYSLSQHLRRTTEPTASSSRHSAPLYSPVSSTPLATFTPSILGHTNSHHNSSSNNVPASAHPSPSHRLSCGGSPGPGGVTSSLLMDSSGGASILHTPMFTEPSVPANSSLLDLSRVCGGSRNAMASAAGSEIQAVQPSPYYSLRMARPMAVPPNSNYHTTPTPVHHLAHGSRGSVGPPGSLPVGSLSSIHRSAGVVVGASGSRSRNPLSLVPMESASHTTSSLTGSKRPHSSGSSNAGGGVFGDGASSSSFGAATNPTGGSWFHSSSSPSFTSAPHVGGTNHASLPNNNSNSLGGGGAPGSMSVFGGPTTITALPRWVHRRLQEVWELHPLASGLSYDALQLPIAVFYTAQNLLFQPLTPQERSNIQRCLATAFGVPQEGLHEYLAVHCTLRFIQQHEELMETLGVNG